MDFRLAVTTWHELVSVDGLKAAKTLIDTRTDLDNTLTTYGLPMKPLVAEKLEIMDSKIRDLDVVLSKLGNQLHKMSTGLDNMELLINEAHRTKGWNWVASEPLWCTWPMDKFYRALLELIPTFIHSLGERREITDILRPHNISFERSREALQSWSTLGMERWDELDDLFSVEIDGWPLRKY